MKLLATIVFARMKRQKIRLAFVLSAIAASSCLIVWTVGGYQSLFTEAASEEADYLGVYDLKLGAANDGFGDSGGMPRGGGGGFGGPFAGRPSAPNVSGQNAQGFGATKNASGTRSGERPGIGDGSSKTLKDRFAYARNADGKIEISKTTSKIPSHILQKLQKLDENQDGFLDRDEEKKMAMNQVPVAESGGFGGLGTGTGGRGGRPGANGEFVEASGRGGFGGRGGETTIPRNLIDEIRNDPSVILCDETVSVRGFVFSKQMKSRLQSPGDANESTSKKTNDARRSETPKDDDVLANAEQKNDEVSAVPDGIDPELHRKGLAAYRAAMGTPLGLGTIFFGTTAKEPPFELLDGKWLRRDANAGEAVLTSGGAELFKVRPGDDLLVLTKTAEYQLKVVGIVEDSTSNGFYVSKPIAEKIAEKSLDVRALGLKLRGDAENFCEKWEPRIQKANAGLKLWTTKEIAARKKETAQRQGNPFEYQAISGTLLAVLASIFIVFTTLNASVVDQKRQIACYRTIGLTRGQIGASVLFESLILSIPGWLGGMITGWLLLYWNTGKAASLNGRTIGVSFLCAVVGAIVAAFYPMIRSLGVKPLDAINDSDGDFFQRTASRKSSFYWIVFAVLGAIFVCGDLYLVYGAPASTARKAALHAGVGILSLSIGILLWIPVLIRLAEIVFIPIFAVLFRFDRYLLRSELSGNLGRTTAVAVVLSVGGGLFVLMQIWGYSMLGPFLPGSETPERFAAFLPIGLKSEFVEELKNVPGVKKDEFLPIAVEQAAFAKGTVKPQEGSGGMGGQFANVVFFGADVEKAFDGSNPLIGLRLIQGDREKAIEALNGKRGVIITDSISVDFGLNVGDLLEVVHPRDETKILKYPIVGVVAFPGWQWLSKTGGVRRNFGRSGGIAFANEKDVLSDYQIDRYSYFWFNTDGSRTYSEMEEDLDKLAQKNLKTETAFAERNAAEPSNDWATTVSDSATSNGWANAADESTGQAAYVKLSTRDSLTDSISSRADSVIWGLSKMPLITLIITSIAVVGTITNSVRSRRWQFGVMRAIGTTRGAVVRMILVEAILVGIVASISSFLFGLLAAQGALKLGRSLFGTVDPPLIFPWDGLGFGFALTLSLCLAAAIYPALTTGWKQPLQLLQEGRGTN